MEGRSTKGGNHDVLQCAHMHLGLEEGLNSVNARSWGSMEFRDEWLRKSLKRSVVMLPPRFVVARDKCKVFISDRWAGWFGLVLGPEELDWEAVIYWALT